MGDYYPVKYLLEIVFGMFLLVVLCVVYWLLNRKDFKEEEVGNSEEIRNIYNY